MNTSQEVKNIYSAIIKARPEIVPVAKNKSARNYKYATLDSLIELLSLVLPKYELGWVQTLSTQEGKPVLITRIIHTSGEWIEDGMVMPQTKLAGGANESQELGASITYFKRYALSAMFGIATDEDTDGIAETRERKQQVRANARATSQAQQQGQVGDEERAADCAGVQIHNPTPEKPMPAVVGSVKVFPEIVKSTGDEAIDREIMQMVVTMYKGKPLFTQKTVEWLNGEISKKTPQEALASARKAAQKRMNNIDENNAA